MPKTITVQPGETLWEIAQRELGAGARWKELGAQIGITTEEQARRLRPGTVLTIPEVPEVKPIAPAPTVPVLPYETPEVMEIKKRIEEITEELKPKVELMEKVKAIGLKPEEKIPDWLYQVETPEEAAAMIKPMRIKELEGLAFAPPPKSYEEIFEEAYETAELASIKKKIEDLDAKILQKKRDLYAGEAEIIENPWLSEAGRVGRIRKLYDIAQKDISLLVDERKTLVEQYNEGVKSAERVAERTLKGWEAQQELYKAELGYLTRTEKGEKLLTISELKELNTLLPPEKRLKYGATREEAIAMGIAIPGEMIKEWTEFTDLEKRKLKAAGIDWTTPEGYAEALEALYPEKEEKPVISRATLNKLALAGVPNDIALDIQDALNSGFTLEQITEGLAKSYVSDPIRGMSVPIGREKAEFYIKTFKETLLKESALDVVAKEILKRIELE